jgi:hypothetical protein
MRYLHLIRSARFSYLVKQAQTKKIRQLKEKHPELAEAIDAFVAGDPTGKHAYLNWAVRQAVKGEPYEEIVTLLESFHKNQRRIMQKELDAAKTSGDEDLIKSVQNKVTKARDLYGYKTLGDLRGAIEDLANTRTRSEEKKNAHENADVVHNRNRFKVVFPKTTNSSCYFGAGTQWCVSATESHNYFYSYSGSGTMLYFMIDKEAEARSPYSKVAFSGHSHEPHEQDFSDWEIFDANDSPVSIKMLKEHFGEDNIEFQLALEKINQHHANTPFAPMEYYTKLLDKDSTEKQMPEKTLLELAEKFEKEEPQLFIEIVTNRNFPEAKLKEYVSERDLKFMSSVLIHKKLSDEWINELISSGDDDMTSLLIETFQLTPKQLIKLLTISDLDFAPEIYNMILSEIMDMWKDVPVGVFLKIIEGVARANWINSHAFLRLAETPGLVAHQQIFDSLLNLSGTDNILNRLIVSNQKSPERLHQIVQKLIDGSRPAGGNFISNRIWQSLDAVLSNPELLSETLNLIADLPQGPTGAFKSNLHNEASQF